MQDTACLDFRAISSVYWVYEFPVWTWHITFIILFFLKKNPELDLELEIQVRKFKIEFWQDGSFRGLILLT